MIYYRQENERTTEILLEALLQDVLVRGNKAILDRCYDRTFCRLMGLDYSDRYNFSIIEQTLMEYKQSKLK